MEIIKTTILKYYKPLKNVVIVCFWITIFSFAGRFLASYIIEALKKIDAKGENFYSEHICAIIGLPTSIYVASVATVLVGLTDQNSEKNEIMVLGLKSGRSIGLLTIWLLFFIVFIFAIKFVW